MPATLLWFLFDWRGRIGRNAYRIAWLVVALLAASLEYLPVKAGAFLAGLAATQFVVAQPLDSKRLHDIGLSAFWLLATNVAGVAASFGLIRSMPELAPALSEKLTESIGLAAASSPVVCIVVAGLGLGAVVRSPFLWALDSKAAGAAYDYDPRARALAAASVEGAVSAGAEAALAQALIDQRLQQAAASLAQMAQAGGGDRKTARKTFGRRVA